MKTQRNIHTIEGYLKSGRGEKRKTENVEVSTRHRIQANTYVQAAMVSYCWITKNINTSRGCGIGTSRGNLILFLEGKEGEEDHQEFVICIVCSSLVFSQNLSHQVHAHTHAPWGGSI